MNTRTHAPAPQGRLLPSGAWGEFMRHDLPLVLLRKWGDDESPRRVTAAFIPCQAHEGWFMACWTELQSASPESLGGATFVPATYPRQAAVSLGVLHRRAG